MSCPSNYGKLFLGIFMSLVPYQYLFEFVAGLFSVGLKDIHDIRDILSFL